MFTFAIPMSITHRVKQNITKPIIIFCNSELFIRSNHMLSKTVTRYQQQLKVQNNQMCVVQSVRGKKRCNNKKHSKKFFNYRHRCCGLHLNQTDSGWQPHRYHHRRTVFNNFKNLSLLSSTMASNLQVIMMGKSTTIISSFSYSRLIFFV